MTDDTRRLYLGDCRTRSELDLRIRRFLMRAGATNIEELVTNVHRALDEKAGAMTPAMLDPSSDDNTPIDATAGFKAQLEALGWAFSLCGPGGSRLTITFGDTPPDTTQRLVMDWVIGTLHPWMRLHATLTDGWIEH